MRKLVFLTVFLLFPIFSVYSQSIAEKGNTNKDLEKIPKTMIIVQTGFESLLNELNRLGKLGYRVERSINFGGIGASQEYAAYLVLDAGNSYQFDAVSSPNKRIIETRLSAKASNGFSFIDSFGVTLCGKNDFDIENDPTNKTLEVFNFTKGDVFLMVKQNDQTTPLKEYKALTAQLGLGKDPVKKLQTELDNLPDGFRPIKILFNKTGFIDISVSILLEKKLDEPTPSKIQYKFLKEVNGFEKEINLLSSQGFRLFSGRKIGLVKFALMVKEVDEKSVYTMIELKNYLKDFEKTTNLGNSFAGMFPGDVDCSSVETVGSRFYFVNNSTDSKHEYKILNLLYDNQTKTLTRETLDELSRFENEHYKVRDLFHFKGLKVILER